MIWSINFCFYYPNIAYKWIYHQKVSQYKHHEKDISFNATDARKYAALHQSRKSCSTKRQIQSSSESMSKQVFAPNAYNFKFNRRSSKQEFSKKDSYITNSLSHLLRRGNFRDTFFIKKTHLWLRPSERRSWCYKNRRKKSIGN